MNNKEEKKVIKVSVWFALCNIIQKIAVLISVPIFTRLIIPEEYGLVAVFQSWNNILIIIVTLSLSMGVFNNGMLKYEHDRNRYVSSMQGLSSLSAIFFLIMALFLRNVLIEATGLPISSILLMFIYYIFQPSFEYWTAKNRYEYKYKWLLVATIIYAIATIIVPVIAVLSCTGNLGVVKINSTLCTLIIFTFVFYVINWVKGRTLYVKEYWKYAFWFNLPLIPNYLSNMLLHQVDRIMIDKICGSTYAAIYSVACYLQTGVTIMINAINATFVPWLYERLKNKDYKSIQKRSESILIIIGGITFGIISCTPEIIHIIAPKEYWEAIWVVPPVVLGTYITILYMFFANVEIYYEKRIFMTCATTVAALINMVLNAILIPLFGYIACAYTTIISYIIYVFAHYIFTNRILTEDGRHIKEIRIYSIRRHMLICTIVGVFCVLQMLLFRFMVIRFIILFAIIIFLYKRWGYKLKEILK